MRQLFGYITEFIFNAFNDLRKAISAFINGNTDTANNLHLSIENFNNFFDKNIINGDLINISLTYRELIFYILPLLIGVLLIVFMVKLISKLIGFIRI